MIKKGGNRKEKCKDDAEKTVASPLLNLSLMFVIIDYFFVVFLYKGDGRSEPAMRCVAVSLERLDSGVRSQEYVNIFFVALLFC